MHTILIHGTRRQETGGQANGTIENKTGYLESTAWNTTLHHLHAPYVPLLLQVVQHSSPYYPISPHPALQTPARTELTRLTAVGVCCCCLSMYGHMDGDADGRNRSEPPFCGWNGPSLVWCRAGGGPFWRGERGEWPSPRDLMAPLDLSRLGDAALSCLLLAAFCGLLLYSM